MRYFLANGFRPSAHPPQIHDHGYSDIQFGRISGETLRQRIRRYREAGVALPKLGEVVFLRHKRFGRISVFVHGAYDAFIMIVATSQRKAYLLGNALRAALSCFHGHPPLEQTPGYLLELSKPPDSDMSGRELANLINLQLDAATDDDPLLQTELQSGTLIDHLELTHACALIRNALEHLPVLDALLHLHHSRTVAWGFMVGSFYESHYSPDRRDLGRYALQRILLENRLRYDSAFVSGFRGLECVLGKPQFRRHEIQGLLRGTDARYGTSFANSRHRSWHEVFSSKRKWWTYADLIAHYLKLRNAVSAHGNPSPPYIVMEDQVFEIQYLLQSMLAEILIPEANGTEPRLGVHVLPVAGKTKLNSNGVHCKNRGSGQD